MLSPGGQASSSEHRQGQNQERCHWSCSQISVSSSFQSPWCQPQMQLKTSPNLGEVSLVLFTDVRLFVLPESMVSAAAAAEDVSKLRRGVLGLVHRRPSLRPSGIHGVSHSCNFPCRKTTLCVHSRRSRVYFQNAPVHAVKTTLSSDFYRSSHLYLSSHNS